MHEPEPLLRRTKFPSSIRSKSILLLLSVWLLHPKVLWLLEWPVIINGITEYKIFCKGNISKVGSEEYYVMVRMRIFLIIEYTCIMWWDTSIHVLWLIGDIVIADVLDFVLIYSSQICHNLNIYQHTWNPFSKHNMLWFESE